MKQMKVALPDELRARLDDASEKNDRSIAEEIRIRLQTSLERDVDVDRPLSDFLENVARIAAEIERERGAVWHKHAGAHEVLTLAIQIWLGELRPAGPTAFNADWPHATVFSDDPHQLASLIVHRLRKEPGFTSSKTRQWMEEEHQRLRTDRMRADRTMGSPRALLDTPQQQRKPDQPKKGKKS